MILLLPLLQCQVLKLNLSDFGQQQQQHYHRRGTCQCQLLGKASALQSVRTCWSACPDSALNPVTQLLLLLLPSTLTYYYPTYCPHKQLE